MITVTLAGRLGKDAELRQAGQSNVCSFSVAGDTGFGNNKQSHWFNCSLWGAQGQALQPYLVKGQEVVIVGEFSEREYQGKFYKELRVNSIKLMGGKSQQQGQQAPQQQQQPQAWGQQQQQAPQAPQGFNNQLSGGQPSNAKDDDIPFMPHFAG